MEYLREIDYFFGIIGSYIMMWGPFLFLGLIGLLICLAYPPLLLLVPFMLIQVGFAWLSQQIGLAFVTWIPMMLFVGWLMWGFIYYGILGKGK